jgi:hypothetical protein
MDNGVGNKMSRFINKVGKKYGYLEVISLHEVVKREGAVWLCKCTYNNCGKEVVVRGYSLETGNTKSCGCFNSDEAKKRLFIDGRSDSKEYAVYDNMHSRCYNHNNKRYKDYGERGITICDRWNRDNPEGYQNFIFDMGNLPSDKHTIDRINNDGIYDKDNCRWVLRDVQSKNRRNTILVTIGDQTLCLKDWATKMNLSYNKLYKKYINLGNSAALKSYIMMPQ